MNPMIKIQNDTEAMRQFASMLESNDPHAIKLQCSHCGLEVDTYVHAYDDTAAELLKFVEHTAYDHGGRADILEVQLKRFARVMTPQEEEDLALDIQLRANRNENGIGVR
jgi:hypothetical protein